MQQRVGEGRVARAGRRFIVKEGLRKARRTLILSTDNTAVERREGAGMGLFGEAEGDKSERTAITARDKER